MRIAILAAFPQELKYIKRHFNVAKGSENLSRVPLGSTPPHEVMLVQTGMGIPAVDVALRDVLKIFVPDLIASIGFGGALYRGARIGDLVWASSSLLYSEGTLRSIDIQDAGRRAAALHEKVEMRRGNVITLERWAQKAEVVKVLPVDVSLPVCDMETYPVARLCMEKRIPFFAVRAITDIAGEEIPAKLLAVVDASGTYKRSRALMRIILSPWLIPHIIKLYRASEKASANLSVFVQSFIKVCDHALPK